MFWHPFLALVGSFLPVAPGFPWRLRLVDISSGALGLTRTLARRTHGAPFGEKEHQAGPPILSLTDSSLLSEACLLPPAL